MHYRVIKPEKDGGQWFVHITDGFLHYASKYETEPPEAHKAIHLARAEEQFKIQRKLMQL